MNVVNLRRVIIESPYAGDVTRNIRYARACLADSLSRGEAPLASHLLYTQEGVLDDSIPEEREKGIEAGYEWMSMAQVVVFYTDFGLSPGMHRALLHAAKLGIPTDDRKLGGEWSEGWGTKAQGIGQDAS